jgi:hypothetical protein
MKHNQTTSESNWNFISYLLGVRSHDILNLSLFWYDLLEVLIQALILLQKHNSQWIVSKSPENQLNLHILSTGCEIAPYIKFELILISFAWGFKWRFNSAANLSYKGFGYLDIREWPINLHLLFVWYLNTKYWIWDHFNIFWSMVKFASNSKTWSFLFVFIKFFLFLL